MFDPRPVLVPLPKVNPELPNVEEPKRLLPVFVPNKPPGLFALLPKRLLPPRLKPEPIIRIEKASIIYIFAIKLMLDLTIITVATAFFILTNSEIFE